MQIPAVNGKPAQPQIPVDENNNNAISQLAKEALNLLSEQAKLNPILDKVKTLNLDPKEFLKYLTILNVNQLTNCDCNLFKFALENGDNQTVKAIYQSMTNPIEVLLQSFDNSSPEVKKLIADFIQRENITIPSQKLSHSFIEQLVQHSEQLSQPNLLGFICFCLNKSDLILLSKVLKKVNSLVSVINNPEIAKSIIKHLGKTPSYPKTIKFFVENGYPLSEEKKWENSLLFYAIHTSSDLKLTQYLLKKGANPNIQGFNSYFPKISENNPLLYCVNRLKYEFIDLLLENGADINFQEKSGDTALHILAKKVHVPEVSKLLKTLITDKTQFIKNNNNQNFLAILFESLGKESKQFIKSILEDKLISSSMIIESIMQCTLSELVPLDLIRKYLPTEAVDSNNNNLLHYICSRATHLTKFPLSKYKHLLNNVNKDNKTPLQLAIKSGNINAISLFLDSKLGCKINEACDGKSILEVVFNTPYFTKVIEMGANPNIHFISTKETPLSSCIRSKNDEMVSYLIHNKADVNFPNAKGESPLSVAAKMNSRKFIDLLIEKGANDFSSLLKYAVELDTLEFCNYLFQKGLKPSTVDSEGNTLLHYAAQFAKLDFAKYFIEKGCYINVVNKKNGNTPFHFCFPPNGQPLSKNQEELANYFLKQKADFFVKNHSHIYVCRLITVSRNKTLIDTLLESNPTYQKSKDLQKGELFDFSILLDFINKNDLPFVETIEISLIFEHFIENITSGLVYAKALKLALKKWPTIPLDWYITLLVKQNPKHVNRVPKENSIPDADPNIDIQKLSKFLDKLNFKNPAEKPYFNPLDIEIDSTHKTYEEIKRGLNLLIERVLKQIPHIGTPKEDKPIELKIFYTKLHNLLRHLTSFIETETDHEKIASCLFELGYSGQFYCGTRWLAESLNFYRFFEKKSITEDPPSLIDLVDIELRELRSTSLFQMSRGDSHLYNQYMRILGNFLKLNGAEAFTNFSDPTLVNPPDFNTSIAKFLAFYRTKVIFRQIANLFTNLHKRELLQLEPPRIEEWFKNNMDSMALEVYKQDEILKTLALYKTQFDPVEYIVQAKKLLEKNNIPIEREQTPEEAVIADKAAEYLSNEIIDMNTGNLKMEALILLLKKIEVFTELVPGVLAELFKQEPSQPMETSKNPLKRPLEEDKL